MKIILNYGSWGNIRPIVDGQPFGDSKSIFIDRAELLEEILAEHGIEVVTVTRDGRQLSNIRQQSTG